ncbi:MAG: hypothetical protein U0572_10765 [Phycisphaerales bacterium]
MRERSWIGIAALTAAVLTTVTPTTEGGSSDCCTAWGGIGCDDLTCQEVVCAIDEFCCAVQWDDVCANKAVTLCGPCGGGGSDCCFPRGNSTGCDDADCTFFVCNGDPWCCGASWDLLCAREAIAQCGVCGGDCCTAWLGHGCGDATCEAAVCAQDPFCCTSSWDSICAEDALSLCRTICDGEPDPCCLGFGLCGDPACTAAVCAVDQFCCQVFWDSACAHGAMSLCQVCGGGVFECTGGECCSPNGGHGCDDTYCCESICAFDPSCCSSAWDAVCAELALNGCGVCGVGSDCCRIHGASGCDDAACEFAVCLIDHYCCTAAWDSSCVEEATSLCIVCTTSGEISSCCFGDGVSACSDAACVATVCPLDPFCCATSWDAYCSQQAREVCHVCGIRSDCCGPRNDAGCTDAACETTVCLVDPACCETLWDMGCAEIAHQLCPACVVAPHPANDECESSMPIGDGTTLFSTIGATTGAPPLSTDCEETYATHFVGDVWFSYAATCTGTATFATCGGASFDTVIALYANDCDGALTLVACDDDAPECGTASSITARVECGARYLLRVGGFVATGTGAMTITCSGSCGCPGDLDGDGVTNAVDLGILLGGWGTSGATDLDGNGTTDAVDLGILLGCWSG